ncbi:MAG: hypoxanthine phosphoribosyltransferase [Acidobacteriota bacterium]
MSQPPALQPLAPLLSAEQIAHRVGELAVDIRRDFPGDVHLVAVLKGAFVFLADLARRMPGDLSMDFIALASYGRGTTTSGEVRLVRDLDIPLDGKDVVIVEDIVDTGRTLVYLQNMLLTRRPRTLATVCLLDKPSRRQVEAAVDYVGFTIEDHFVVGYGLDHDERYRQLPYLAVLPSPS